MTDEHIWSVWLNSDRSLNGFARATAIIWTKKLTPQS
jgi:hypothetical protein